MNASIKEIKNIFDLERKTKILGTSLEVIECFNHCPFCETKTKLKYSRSKYQMKYFLLQQQIHNERFRDFARWKKSH